MTDWIPYANLLLNVLLIPLLLIMNGIKIELGRLTSTIDSHGERIGRIERKQDKEQ
jgi:hypothetical protein